MPAFGGMTMTGACAKRRKPTTTTLEEGNPAMLFKCDAHPHVHAPAAEGGHATTVRAGKRHFTVDIHCHVHVPDADAMLKDARAADQKNLYVDTNALTADLNRQLGRESWRGRVCQYV